MLLERIWKLLLYRIQAITAQWWTAFLIVVITEVLALVYIRKKPGYNRLVIGVVLFDWFLVIMMGTVLSRKPYAPESLRELISFDISTAWTVGSGVYSAIDTYMELIMNILMYVPFGYLLTKLSKGKSWIVFGGSFLITMSVEVLQLVMKRGFFELADILLNMVGVFLGYTICRVIRRCVTKCKVRNRDAR